jgi:hypothetical protein
MLFMDNEKGVREGITREELKVEKFVENIMQIHLQVREMLNNSHERYKACHN